MFAQLHDGTRPPHCFLQSRHPTALSMTMNIKEPRPFFSAQKDPHWRATMLNEFHALMDNHTWDLAPPLSTCNVIGWKWVSTVKQKLDGSADQLEARLVAQAFNQCEGIDYEETSIQWLSMLPFTWLFLLLSLFSGQPEDLMLKIFFFMILLKKKCTRSKHGLHRHFSAVIHLPPVQVDLWASSRLLERGSFLHKPSFQGSNANASLFILFTNDYVIFILIYLDDFILTGLPNALFSSLLTDLLNKVAMKDLCPLSYILGIEVQPCHEGPHLIQSKYLYDILDRSSMRDCKPSLSLVTSGPRLLVYDGNLLVEPSLYRRIVDSLQYLTLTQLDIAYVVQHACQFMHQLSQVHYATVKLILHYLKWTIIHGLFIDKGSLSILH